MIIHSLKASGFRIIGEPMDIRFPDEGRIGILGQNESGKNSPPSNRVCTLWTEKRSRSGGR